MRIHRVQSRIIQITGLLALLVLISGLMNTSFWGNSGNNTNGTAAKDTQQTAGLTNTKIVALGDSFTLGYPLGADSSWTQTLADKLQVTVVNKGKSQQTAEDLLARFEDDVLAENPGRVIIFAGTGDAIQNVSLSNYQNSIQEMVKKAKSNNIIPILALPVWFPDYEQTIENIREWEISYAQSENILVLDFKDTLFDTNKKYLSGLSSDGKYPNAKGYKTMGEYAARVLK
ncbi:MAG TPA: GDSL-type esterase/lipase family protein [Desulfitobacteriaceae bacterium]|nr:GDSL-type esterase/lipase family protein [Desulfitobacteriaceae bacterium]